MKKIIILQLSILLLFSSMCFAGEMRGMWVATVANLDYPTKATTNPSELKSEALEIINNCNEMGINNIFLQVRPMSDAFYKSSIYPWSSYLTGSQGTAPDDGFDPLSYWIDECHKRGIKLHAWINPYRATRSNTAVGEYYKNLANLNPAKQHPEYLIKYENNYYYDPALPEVRQLVIDGAMEIVNNYDIDGIHFDDYFYPGMEDFDDSASFAKYGSGFDNKADWRRDNVNKLISGVSEKIRESKPNVEFGISPCGIWANSSTTPLGSDTRGMESYTQLYADTRKWALENTIDYIAPQVYWNIGFEVADYKKLASWWADTLKDSKTKLYIGMGDYRMVDAEAGSVWYGTDEINRQLDLNESLDKISGEIHYRYKSVMSVNGLSSVYKERYHTFTVQEEPLTSVNTDTQTDVPQHEKTARSAEGAGNISFISENGNVDVTFSEGKREENVTVDGMEVKIAELDEIYTNMGSYAVTVGSYELNSPKSLKVSIGVPEINDTDKYYVIGLNKN
ncbi:MAG: family 10 glycosylhydrolase, partial [Firmicutes bacterium]|nr:family 10 glycosylhydrolase [Bacillota bacterium]